MKLNNLLFPSLLTIALFMGYPCDVKSSETTPPEGKQRLARTKGVQPKRIVPQEAPQNIGSDEAALDKALSNQAEADIGEGEQEAQKGNIATNLDTIQKIVKAPIPKRDYTYQQAHAGPGIIKKVLPTIPVGGDVGALANKSLDENKKWLHTKATKAILLQCQCLVQLLKDQMASLPTTGSLTPQSLQTFLDDMLKTSNKNYDEIVDSIHNYNDPDTQKLRVRVLQDIQATSGYCTQPFGMLRKMVQQNVPGAQINEQPCIEAATLEGRVK